MKKVQKFGDNVSTVPEEKSADFFPFFTL